MTRTVNALSGRWLIVGHDIDDAESLQWALEDEGCSCMVALPLVPGSVGDIGDAFGIDLNQPNWAELLLQTLDHKHNSFNGLVVISDHKNTSEFNELFHYAESLHLPCWQVICGNDSTINTSQDSRAQNQQTQNQQTQNQPTKNIRSQNLIELATPLDDHVEQIIEQLGAYNEQSQFRTLNNQQNTLSSLSPNQRYQHVFGLLRECLQQVLGVASSAVSPQSSFVDLGVNSLKMLPLRDTLTELTGLPVQVSELYDYHSPDSLVTMLLERFTDFNHENNEKVQSSAKPETATQTPVAIIGMACHFPPNLQSPEAFYDALLAGHDATNRSINSRTENKTLAKDSSPTQANEKPKENEQEQPLSSDFFNQALLDDIYSFDASLFGISPREASAIDPQQRLLLTLSWQALHNACAAIPSLNGTAVGTFVAIGEPDYRATPNAQNYSNGLITTGTHTSMAAGRIAHILGLQGPAMVINTACSSSLVAVDSACTALARGDCDMAIAGGANLMLSDEGTVGMTLLGALSPSFQCRSFDANANGYVRGEGGAIVVLKKLSDAQRNNDNIRAVILGSAVNHDGKSQGLTAPSGLAQQKVIRTALQRAGVASRTINYVETHGTGTPLGDPIEIHALQNVYNAAGANSSLIRNMNRSEPLKVGSHKSNIGHLEQAAGIAGLVKTVLCLEQQQIPGNIHFNTPNPQIDWANIQIKVVDQKQPWCAEDGTPLRAGVSSFGFSGTNCHVIVEAASTNNTASTKQNSTGTHSQHSQHLLLLSAHHPEALHRLAQRYLIQLQDQDELTTSRICYTASKLTQHKYRFACSGNTNTALIAQLNKAVESNALQQAKPTSQFMPQVAFVFAGQGSQYSRMAAKWYEHNAVFKATLDRCDALARPWLNNVSLVELLTESAADDLLLDASLLDKKTKDEVAKQNTANLHHTRWTQPALFAFHAAMLEMWNDFGVEPAIVAGHSLGEYSAAYTAGVLSLEDGLQLLCERGRLVALIDDESDREPTGAMIALKGEPDTLDTLFTQSSPLTQSNPLSTLFNDNQIAIAAKNSPNQIVLSGFAAPIQQAIDIIEALPDLPQHAISITRLNVSHGFHSPHLDSMVTPFRDFLAKDPVKSVHTSNENAITFHAPKLTLISNLTGEPTTENQCQTPEYWTQHLRDTVQFDATCQWLQQHADVIIEVGGNPHLVPLLKSAPPAKTSPPVLYSGKRKRSATQDIAQLLGDLFCAGVECNLDEFFNAQSHLLPLYPPPLYPLREKELKLPHAQRMHSIEQARSLAQETAPNNEFTSASPESQWLYQRYWQPINMEPGFNHSPQKLDAALVILANDNSPLAQAIENAATNLLAKNLFESDLLKNGLLKNDELKNKVARFSHNNEDEEITRYLNSTNRSHPSTTILVLDLRCVPGKIASDNEPLNPGSAAENVVSQTVSLLQTLTSSQTNQTSQPAPNIRYWLGTQSAQSVFHIKGAAHIKDNIRASEEEIAPHLAPLWGLGRTLAMEQPENWGGLIDVDQLSVQHSEKLAALLLQLLLVPIRNTSSNAKNHELQQWAIRGEDCQLFQAQLQRVEADIDRLSKATYQANETEQFKRAIQPNRTIILTGGLGFIGQQLMATLVAAGATHLVLTTRLPEPTLPTQVERYRDQGVNITVINHCDLCDPKGCEALLAQANQIAPLGGIIHLAGHLEDAMLPGITPEQITATFASKITSSWQLHCASQQYDLSFFALFSSAASVFGSPGQSVYAAANSYLEALSQLRKQQGLPASTFHWGAIGTDTFQSTEAENTLGMYGKLDNKQQQRLGQLGLTPLAADAAMALFVRLINESVNESRAEQHPSVDELTIIDIDWQQWAAKLTHTGKSIPAQFSDLLETEALTIDAQTNQSPESPQKEQPLKALIAQMMRSQELRSQEQESPTEQLYEALKQHITQLLLAITRDTLQLPLDEIDADRPLTDQGLDSIMSMEIISDIRSQLDFMIYPNELARFGTITLLAEYLTQELVPAEPQNASKTPSHSSPKQSVTNSFLPVLPDQKLSHTSFVLSTPRAGSTLLRAMLAGHSQLFVPPELHLLSYGTMAERASALAQSDLSEGLQRAFMEFGLNAEQAADTIQEFEQQDAPVWQVYHALQKQLNHKQANKNQHAILIDKSPVYAANKAILHAADAMFTNVNYIHLVRHPLAVIESFVRMRMHQVAGEGSNSALSSNSSSNSLSHSPYALAEQIWREYNQNIVDFFSDIKQSTVNDSPSSRVLTLRYEDLVAEPAPYMQQIAGLLSVPYQASMLTPYDGKRMTNGVHGHSMGVGDPNFLQHNRIDQQQAEKWQQLDLPVKLHSDTIALAEQLGYHIPDQYCANEYCVSESRSKPSHVEKSHAPAATIPTCKAKESSFFVQDHELCLCQWGELTEPAQPTQPMALLVHGLQDQATIWQSVAEHLVSEGYVVFAPDLRGHGKSSHSEPGYSYPLLNYVNDLVQTVAHIQSQAAHSVPLHLVGHSLGSAICATYAHLYPEEIAQLTLVEPVLLADSALVGSALIERDLAENTSDSSHSMPFNGKNKNSLRSSLQLSLHNIQQPHQHTPLVSVKQAAALLQQSTPALSAEMALQLAQRATVPANDQQEQVIWRWDPILTSRAGMGFPGTRQQYLQLLSEISVQPFSVILGANSPFNRPADLNDLHSALRNVQKSYAKNSDAQITTIPGTHTLPIDNPSAIAHQILNAAGSSR